MYRPHPGHDVTGTPIVVSDCGDEDSLNTMARRGRVVINCCGPYKLYGEPVVKACVQNGAHHVDVSGELEVNVILFCLTGFTRLSYYF